VSHDGMNVAEQSFLPVSSGVGYEVRKRIFIVQIYKIIRYIFNAAQTWLTLTEKGVITYRLSQMHILKKIMQDIHFT
jgi:hypothetical protein